MVFLLHYVHQSMFNFMMLSRHQ